MSSKLSVILFCVIFLVCGCSEAPKTVKPVQPAEKSLTDMSISQAERKLAGDTVKFNSMSFPLFENLSDAETWMSIEVSGMHRSIQSYKDMRGSFPDSIAKHVESGLLLTWPRNLQDGKPMKCVIGRNLDSNRTDWGSFQYETVGENNFKTKVVSLDKDQYDQTGTEVWSVQDRENMLKLDQNQTRLSSIMGGRKQLDEIHDDSKRTLYVLCGLLSQFLHGRVNIHHPYAQELPETFGEVIDNRLFIIKENYENLRAMLADSNAIFKWGVDHSKNCVYTLLEIDGERYIEYCVSFGPMSQFPDKQVILGTCDINELDLSSPIIDNKNISKLVIPDEYLISIKDLPLNEN